MLNEERLHFMDSLKTLLIFLVVLTHAGVVYESSGVMAPYWIVDDPATSDFPGLLNLFLDIFVMPAIFFISGYFTPASLKKKGGLGFLKARFIRLMVPWTIAVFTLMPLFKAIFLYSRGLPQESWTTYFHFSNGVLSMSWLWFLPVLFLFNLVYTLLSKLNISMKRLGLGWAVAGAFLLSVVYTMALGQFEMTGWTKSPLLDFQNERLLPYFLVFLIGALCYRREVLVSKKRNLKLYIAINATAWIPINVYMIVLLNFFLHPGEHIVSELVDGLLFWPSLHLSMLSLLYSLVATFKYFLNRRIPFIGALSELTYGVYIIHIAVMGPLALALLDMDLPALVKYPILAVISYGGSNLVVHLYRKILFHSPAISLLKKPARALRGAS